MNQKTNNYTDSKKIEQLTKERDDAKVRVTELENYAKNTTGLITAMLAMLSSVDQKLLAVEQKMDSIPQKINQI
jgi:hypothetical protein